MPRDIAREDGSGARHTREPNNGDHRVRDYGDPEDGRLDRVYGRSHSNVEVREKERDIDPPRE